MSSVNREELPKNSIWLVTGVSSGIGLSLVGKIIEAGHRVVGLSRDPSRVPLPATSNAENTHLLAVDLSDTSSIHQAYEAAVAHFGRIDVLINNAGYALSGELESMTEAEHRGVMEVNYFAPVTLTRLAIANMRTQSPPGGTIAQISSIGGMTSTPGMSAYQSSKHALEGFIKAVVQEMDPAWNIKFISLQPGAVDTAVIGQNMKHSKRHAAYVGRNLPTEALELMVDEYFKTVAADPNKVAEVIVDVIIAGNGPLQLPIGLDAWAMGLQYTQGYQKTLEEWKTLIESTSPEGTLEGLKKLQLA